MSAAAKGALRLVDAPGESRTTATLLASLAARLGVLPLVSGAAAVGSLVAGFAALGREVRRTAHGQRLYRALEAGRAGHNGNALWAALRIDDWTATLPASPVLDQLRNDLALLLADDVGETLELMPIPAQPAGAAADAGRAAAFLDCAVGMWAFGRELAHAVEALAEPTLPPAGEVSAASRTGAEPPGPLLR